MKSNFNPNFNVFIVCKNCGDSIYLSSIDDDVNFTVQESPTFNIYTYTKEYKCDDCGSDILVKIEITEIKNYFHIQVSGKGIYENTIKNDLDNFFI